MPPRPDPSRIRPIVSLALGIVRDGTGLREAAAMLLPIASGRDVASDPALVALMMTVAALRREESRGSHCRSDFAARNAQACRSRLTLDQAFEAALAVTGITAPRVGALWTPVGRPESAPDVKLRV
jgi:L-aspartate oxidase